MIRLREFQKKALKLLEDEIHLLCLAPTGSGKSMIYETLAAKQGARTLLVTPLIALARQQAQRLQAAGVAVTLQTGTKPKPSPPRGSGAWIISPEFVLGTRSLSQLKDWGPNFLVVDECHCLHDWGDEFRRAYQAIPELIFELGINKSLWLSATLPRVARADLVARLGQPLHWLGRFSLPENLLLEVQKLSWLQRVSVLLEKVRTSQGSGLIFVNTRDATHRLQNLLSVTGKRVWVYHAGMSSEERRQIEEKCRSQEPTVLIATSAFGMGMDYPGFRWCILWQPPLSLLALAQALGRVGRSRELPAHCTLFWDEDDFRNLQMLALNSVRQTSALREVQQFFAQQACRVSLLEKYFNSPGQQPTSETKSVEFCGRCDICRKNSQKTQDSRLVLSTNSI